MAKNIKKILVIRTDRIGEVLLTTPVVTALKQAYPDAKISVMVRPEVKDLLEGNPYVDEIIEYKQHCYFRSVSFPRKRESIHGVNSSKNLRKEWITAFAVMTVGRSVVEAFQLEKMLRDKKFDMAIIVNPKKEFHLAAFLAGIPIRVGFDRKWGFLLTHKIKDVKYLGKKHEVEYNLDLVRLLGVEPADKRPVLVAGENFAPDRFGLFEEARIIAMHPCTSNPRKQWPREYFAKLGDMLSESGFSVVIVSGAENVSIAGDVISMMRNKPLDLSGSLTLKQLATFFKKCKLLVSNDSGPVHVAAAVGTPVVAIFGKADPGGKPERWGPYGEGHIVIQKDRLEDISPEEIFKMISDRFKGENKGK